MAPSYFVCLVIIGLFGSALSQKKPHINPTILQDSRDLPQVDGAFGFLYRTEDGIAHGAVGEPGGQVHGRFTYTDPTGLKVNYNYNTGSRTAPGANYEQNQPSAQTQPAYSQPRAQPQPQHQPQRQPQPQARPRPQPQPVYEEYDEPQPQYEPQPRYQPQPKYQPQPQARPRPTQHGFEPEPQSQHRFDPQPRPSQSRYSRPTAPRNDVDYGSYGTTY